MYIDIIGWKRNTYLPKFCSIHPKPCFRILRTGVPWEHAFPEKHQKEEQNVTAQETNLCLKQTPRTFYNVRNRFCPFLGNLSLEFSYDLSIGSDHHRVKWSGFKFRHDPQKRCSVPVVEAAVPVDGPNALAGF